MVLDCPIVKISRKLH